LKRRRVPFSHDGFFRLWSSVAFPESAQVSAAPLNFLTSVCTLNPTETLRGATKRVLDGGQVEDAVRTIIGTRESFSQKCIDHLLRCLPTRLKAVAPNRRV
jgi:hypothetical protein